MNNWHEIVFDSIYSIPSKNGLTRVTSERGEGYPMVNMNEIFAYGRISNQDMELVLLNEKEQKNSGLIDEDLLFARQSLVESGAGKCSIIINPPRIITFESHLIRVRLDKKIANPMFFYYYFNSPQGKARIQSLVIQVAAAGIRGSELSKLKIRCPDKIIQDKIAFIMSKYDDIIESYYKEKDLLMKIAQLIYNEWFIKYNFPSGNINEFKVIEDVTIPSNWDFDSILNSRFWKLSKSNINKFEGEKEYFATANIIGDEIVERGIITDYESKPSRAQKEPIPYSVWFARMKNSFKILGITDINIKFANNSILSSGFAGFITSSDYFPYLYLTIYSEFFSMQKDVFATGATQESINNEGISLIKIMHPDQDTLKEFSKITLPILNNIFKIKSQIEQLKSEKEFVLTTLMNEKIKLNKIIDDIMVI
jgi:type I restriction enzyme, S subunit